MRLLLYALIILLSALPGGSSIGTKMEMSIGLPTLYKLRGSIIPPDDVLIVSMDKASAWKLGIEHPDLWPRNLHADAISALVEGGAKLIVFNVVFDRARGPDDALLASAIADAGNVILTSALERSEHRIPGHEGDEFSFNRLAPLLPELQAAALSSNPFIIPRYPFQAPLFWLYVPVGNDFVATLPTAVLAYYLADFSAPERIPGERVDELELLADSSLASAIMQRDTDLAVAFLSSSVQNSVASVMTGSTVAMMNYYGPPGAISQISYHELFSDTAIADSGVLQDKVVFIGFDDDLMPEWHPGYHTVYSNWTMTKSSSVELAATAFSNLLQNNNLRFLDWKTHMLLLFLWGGVLTVFVRKLPTIALIMSLATSVVLYTCATVALFRQFDLVTPLAWPILIQLPLIMGLGIWEKYRITQQQRENVLQQARQYLPDNVVASFLNPQLRKLAEQGQEVKGICLSMDIADYTQLANEIEPAQITHIISAYYDIVLEKIRLAGAAAWDAAGDGFMVVWVLESEESKQRVMRCIADIRDGIAEFNKTVEPNITVRFGVHCGDVRLGNLGILNTRTYRAVGDAVNLSSRIEELNKELGCTWLVSGSMARTLSDYCHRYLGKFSIRGIRQEVYLYQVFCPREVATLDQIGLCRRFADAIEEYEAGHNDDATILFRQLEREYPHDGAVNYYLRELRYKAA